MTVIFRTPFFLPLLYPGLIWRMPTHEKEIYLTFDDGPVPGPTHFVLEELEKAKAKATFFCIGDNVHKHPGLFEKVVERGHTIGNHTFSHIKGWNYSARDYVENVRLCEKEFLTHGLSHAQGKILPKNPAQGGARSRLFRPPYGRIKRSQIRALEGYTIIMWDVLTLDYAGNISNERSLRGSITASRPGSIVVFHDSFKAEKKLMYILPRILDHFVDTGYSFKAIPNF